MVNVFANLNTLVCRSNQQESPEHVVSTSEACEVCKSAADFRCQRCKSVHYCKKQHQQQHWPEHKKRCYALSQKDVPITKDNIVQITRHTIEWAVDRLFSAIRDDILPDYDVCQVFGLPKNNRQIQQALFSCYTAAVKTYDITKKQLVDAHMTDTMNELILSIPQIRSSPYGLQVIGAGGIKLERIPGIP